MKGKKSSVNVNLNNTKRWQKALDDANRKLAEMKVYEAKLRSAIRIFKENIAKNLPWPGGSETRD